MGEAAAKEPSMEDILSSIRRIISDDGKADEGQAKSAAGTPGVDANKSADIPLDVSADIPDINTVRDTVPAPRANQPNPSPEAPALDTPARNLEANSMGDANEKPDAPYDAMRPVPPSALTGGSQSLASLAAEVVDPASKSIPTPVQSQPPAPAQTPMTMAPPASPTTLPSAAPTPQTIASGSSLATSADGSMPVAPQSPASSAVATEPVSPASDPIPVAAMNAVQALRQTEASPATSSVGNTAMSSPAQSLTPPQEPQPATEQSYDAVTHVSMEEAAMPLGAPQVPAQPTDLSEVSAFAATVTSLATAEVEDDFKSALMSPSTDDAVHGAFERLKRSAMDDIDAKTEAVLRPMLREWLDEHLPSLVEKLVREEIERVARGS